MKLLIVDDEKIIRETISQQIPWAKLGIDEVKTASNGLEAYDIIMDEYPDIVMTDIKMPGLSGLELIKKIKKIHSDVEFIILSGYGEFEFARTAMQYGVHHYLLKPCNKDQIINDVKDTIDEISQKRASRNLTPSDRFRIQMENTMILNIINECVATESFSQSEDLQNLFRPYEKFMDFTNVPYELYYLYFMDEISLQSAINQIEQFRRAQMPGLNFQILYVYQTLMVFFPSYHLQYDALDAFFSHLSLPSQQITIQYQRVHYNNLKSLIDTITQKLKRYETIYFNNNGTLISICNYRTIMKEVESLTVNIYLKDKSVSEKSLDSLFTILSQITDIPFMKQLISSIIMQSSSKYLDFSSLEATEFLMKIHSMDDIQKILETTIPVLQLIYQKYHTIKSSGGFISDTINNYVRQNLSDSNLSLKWISENILYMNVDYVSKKYYKETGKKFSNYLTELRIQKAKELLTEIGNDKIQNIAELVGCGNNPQYFSQLFKKSTGMTPSAYIKFISGGN
ncbi:response regulator [bacterium]|nr:response regulator [bacterium]MDY3020671.1 response regulator [Oliverpabstia sp.]